MSVDREGGQVPQTVDGACGLVRQAGWNRRQAGMTGGLESQADWNHRRTGSAGGVEEHAGRAGGLEVQVGGKRRPVRVGNSGGLEV